MSGRKATVTYYASPKGSPASGAKANASGGKRAENSGSKGPSIDRSVEVKNFKIEDVSMPVKPKYLACVDRLYEKMHLRDSKINSQRLSVSVCTNSETSQGK